MLVLAVVLKFCIIVSNQQQTLCVSTFKIYIYCQNSLLKRLLWIASVQYKSFLTIKHGGCLFAEGSGYLRWTYVIYLSLENCTWILPNFFLDSSSPLWLTFLADQLQILLLPNKLKVKMSLSFIESSILIENLLQKLISKKDNKFVTKLVEEMLKDLTEEGALTENYFFMAVDTLFVDCVNYISGLQFIIQMSRIFLGFAMTNCLSGLMYRTPLGLCLNMVFLYLSSTRIHFLWVWIYKNTMEQHMQAWVTKKLPLEERWTEIFVKNSKLQYFFRKIGTNTAVKTIVIVENLFQSIMLRICWLCPFKHSDSVICNSLCTTVNILRLLYFYLTKCIKISELFIFFLCVIQISDC